MPKRKIPQPIIFAGPLNFAPIRLHYGNDFGLYSSGTSPHASSHFLAQDQSDHRILAVAFAGPRMGQRIYRASFHAPPKHGNHSAVTARASCARNSRGAKDGSCRQKKIAAAPPAKGRNRQSRRSNIAGAARRFGHNNGAAGYLGHRNGNTCRRR